MNETISYADDRAAYNRQKYHEYKMRNMRFLSEGADPKCRKCGADESLEFDHIDPADKSFNVNGMKSLRNPIYVNELLKCQILCKSCHEEKTALENAGFTHGTIYGFMRAKCTCAECSARKRQWSDEKNAKRRMGDGKGAYGRPSDHGEVLHYRRGCRCDECRAANAAHAKHLRGKKAST